MEPKVEYALQTPDGEWRVEIVKRGRTQWYRLLHGDSVFDWLAQATLERMLHKAGVDMADLVEAIDTYPQAVHNDEHGAA